MRDEIESFSKLNASSQTAPMASAAVDGICSPQAVLLKSGNETSAQLAFFVHGTPGAAADWSQVWDELAKRGLDCRLISLDRPGFGKNVLWADAEDWGTQMDCFHRLLLEEADSRKRLLLVGHSYGAALAAGLARKLRGEREVAGLVLVSGVLSPRERQCRWYHRLLRFPLIAWLVPRKYVQSAREMSAVDGHLTALGGFWSGIDYPVTFVHGDADRLIPIENSRWAAGQMQTTYAKLVDIPSGGHALPKTHAALIADEVVRIFDRIAEEEEGRDER